MFVMALPLHLEFLLVLDTSITTDYMRHTFGKVAICFDKGSAAVAHQTQQD